MKRRIALGVLALAIIVFAAWVRVQPSNERVWQLGQQLLPSSTVSGSRVTIHNVRDFRYHGGVATQQTYGTRTYDLNKIQSVWFVVAPFSKDRRGAAHTFLTFGFADSQYVAVSVEARREADEEYSLLKGLLRRFEIIYVIGDERDLIQLRTGRGVQVYLYPIRAAPEKVRALFVEILQRANELQTEPEFYNTLTNNCTTNILAHANSVADRKIPYGKEILLPGYADELASRLGLVDTDLPLEQARRKYHINDRAARFANDPHFSVRVRSD